METLELNRETAINLFKAKTIDDVRIVLMNTFGSEVFVTKITDRVTSYEDAYELADAEIRSYCEIFPTDTVDVVAYKKLKLIIKVINEGWEPDFQNTSQSKWYPWFRVGASGSGFDCSGTVFIYDHSCTGVGSRLCTFSRDAARYIAETFEKEYEAIFLKQK